MRRIGLIVLVLCFGFCSEIQSQDPPSIPQLVEKGKQTTDRLATSSAGWTSVIELANGAAEARVESLLKGTRQLHRISLVQGVSKVPLATIIQRDGYWYVEQAKTRGKYRPLEAPLDFPSAYMFLAKTEPRVVLEGQEASIGKFNRWEDKTAVFDAEFPEQTKQQLQSAIDTLNALMKQQELPLEARKMHERNQRLIKNGFEIKIDSELGLILQNGAEGNRFWTRDFQFDPPEFEEAFRIEKQQWTDYTDEIAIEKSPSDFFMAMHQPLWKPGQPGGDGNMVFMNMKDGTIRRIPLPVGGGRGCLSLDSRHAYMSHLDIATASMVVVDVDLKSGVIRPLGNPELMTGYCLLPVLSPDGRSLAVLHKTPSATAQLETQIHVIDIESGVSRKIGTPLDTSPIDWLPDGKGLLVNRREIVDFSKPSIGHICAMSLDGVVKPIIDGDPAVVLNHSSRILFCETGRSRWKTCDLEGQDVKDFGDGFSGYGFPAPNRDGTKVIMMKFDQRIGPKPHIIDVETFTSTPINVADGLWSNLSWQ